ncbi:plasmodesmata-located protein 6 [Argentina anserina]|uniref:plasmodesmata-located protein 6 n=1 Tax=Argentina anserina TaxID=57926 RepID=UPI002176573F|nr:plasmodesmata-located protein 6 [Potentilla anserina]
MSLTQKASTGFSFFFLVNLICFASPSSSATDTFIYGGCSQIKFLPGTAYEMKLNSILASVVNSAMFTTYNNFTVPGSSGGADTLYGVFQCRGDLSGTDCAQCVSRAVSRLGTLCLDACGGALQLDGCFVKYDNATFLGVEDKTVVMNKCGPSIGYDSEGLTRRDAVLSYLGTSDGAYRPFRVSGAGNVQGVAQCVGDLSPSECQDCLSDAVGKLRASCVTSIWGDMFLAKCYARYSEGGYHSQGHDHDDDDDGDDDLDRTLAILIGIIAAAALLVVFLSYFKKYLCGDDCDIKGGK